VKNIKILYNQNKLYNEITKDAAYTDQCDEFSIRFVFNGNEHYTIGQKDYNIYPGNFLIINEGTRYDRKIYSDIPANTFAVLFSHKFLADFHYNSLYDNNFLLDNPYNSDASSIPTFLETIYPFTGELKYNILRLTGQFHSWLVDDILIDEYIYYCLFLFYRLYNQEIVAKSEKLNMLNHKTRTEVFKRLNLAKDFILSNYNQTISLEDISQYCCLSTTHLFRTFKQAYNCSPHQFLMQTRLRNAGHLLKTTPYEVNEIVNMVGFDSPSSFIRLFKNKYKLTPGNYRVKHHEQARSASFSVL
jgi:AraC family transcriptional regulator